MYIRSLLSGCTVVGVNGLFHVGSIQSYTVFFGQFRQKRGYIYSYSSVVVDL